MADNDRKCLDTSNQADFAILSGRRPRRYEDDGNDGASEALADFVSEHDLSPLRKAPRYDKRQLLAGQSKFVALLAKLDERASSLGSTIRKSRWASPRYSH